MYPLKRVFFLPLLVFLTGCGSLFSSLRYSTAPYKNETSRLVVPPTLTQPNYNSTYNLDEVVQNKGLAIDKAPSEEKLRDSSVSLIVTSGIRLSEDVSGLTVFVPQGMGQVADKTSHFMSDNGFDYSFGHGRAVIETGWNTSCYYNEYLYRSFDGYRWCSRDRYRITFHSALPEAGTSVSFSHQEESSTISIVLGSRFSRGFKALPLWHSCVGCGRYPLSYVVPRYLSFWGANSSGINLLMLLSRSSTTKINASFPELMRPFTMIINHPVRKSWEMTRKAIVSSGIELYREDFKGASFLIKYLDPSLVPEVGSVFSKISRFLGAGSTTSRQVDVSPHTYVVKLVSDSKYKGTRLLIANYSTGKEDFSPVALRIVKIIYQNY